MKQSAPARVVSCRTADHLMGDLVAAPRRDEAPRAAEEMKGLR
jgi:hypothetical protein